MEKRKTQLRVNIKRQIPKLNIWVWILLALLVIAIAAVIYYDYQTTKQISLSPPTCTGIYIGECPGPVLSSGSCNAYFGAEAGSPNYYQCSSNLNGNKCSQCTPPGIHACGGIQALDGSNTFYTKVEYFDADGSAAHECLVNPPGGINEGGGFKIDGRVWAEINSNGELIVTESTGYEATQYPKGTIFPRFWEGENWPAKGDDATHMYSLIRDGNCANADGKKIGVILSGGPLPACPQDRTCTEADAAKGAQVTDTKTCGKVACKQNSFGQLEWQEQILLGMQGRIDRIVRGPIAEQNWADQLGEVLDLENDLAQTLANSRAKYIPGLGNYFKTSAQIMSISHSFSSSLATLFGTSDWWTREFNDPYALGTPKTRALANLVLSFIPIGSTAKVAETAAVRGVEVVAVGGTKAAAGILAEATTLAKGGYKVVIAKTAASQATKVPELVAAETKGITLKIQCPTKPDISMRPVNPDEAAQLVKIRGQVGGALTQEENLYHIYAAESQSTDATLRSVNVPITPVEEESLISWGLSKDPKLRLQQLGQLKMTNPEFFTGQPFTPSTTMPSVLGSGGKPMKPNLPLRVGRSSYSKPIYVKPK